MSKSKIIPQEVIENQIFVIREKKVMIDRDLASLYEVQTKALNQAVKRNADRFPNDFMFQLSDEEKLELVTNCDRLKRLKYATTNPYAFTEQGVAMLSSVLNSQRAIHVNIEIMRTFTKLREMALTHKDLSIKIDQMERKFEKHDKQFKIVFDTLRNLLVSPKKTRKIGFKKE